MNTKKVIDHIVDWLQRYANETKSKGFVVGVSGGIDSALTSTLCAKTGYPTLLVEMPIHQSPNQVSRAQNHMARLEKEFKHVSKQRVDLTSTFDLMLSHLPESDNEHSLQLTRANTRSRLRMTTLYYLAGLNGYLVAGTGNKIEDFGVGFYTKYGDGGVDLSPIADLTKSEVYACATTLGIHEDILLAPPTDGLFGDERSDEDQIGASYPELEWAMVFSGEETNLSEREKVVLNIYRTLNNQNQHKMQPIPVCSIPKGLK
ncbi:MAG: NAD(+) synthase [Bacteroidetes bacterium]|nr:NAD(+) synthase [Bacteroidota bacterium]